MADTTGETKTPARKPRARKAPAAKAVAPETTRKAEASKAPARKAAAPKAAAAKAPARKAPAQRKTVAAAPERGGKRFGLGTLSIGAAIGAVAAAAFAVLKLGQRARASAEHVPTDLLGDTRPEPGDRAPVDFRPDPTAPIPAGERDAFRPALAGVAAPTPVKGQADDNARRDAVPS